DGFVDGEAVGAVILKPLHRAIADGDHIYGVLKGSMLNAGGKTRGYTVPNPQAQARLVSEVLELTGVHPRTISYIEAHGTGTALGDPIEISALTGAFQQSTQEKQYCAIGSVKSNIGHCESAAGIAGLTKILLQMKYAQLVPSLHAQVLNPQIHFADTPFVVQQELTEWKRPVVELDGNLREYPRLAGISSFGAGGANVHLLVEEYIPAMSARPVSPQEPVAIPLSAKNEERLKEQARRLLVALCEQPFAEHDLPSIGYTLQVGREALEERLAFVVGSLQELKEKLRAFLDDLEDSEGLYRGQVRQEKGTIALFAKDDELAEAVEKWIARRKYHKLLDLWARGLHFDWSKLYGVVKPERISLPTYAFAREHYWMTKTGPGLVASKSGDLTNHLIEGGSQTEGGNQVGEATSLFMLYPDWQEQPLPLKMSAPKYAEHHVLLCEPEVLPVESLKTWLPGASCSRLRADSQDAGEYFQSCALHVFTLIQDLLPARSQNGVLLQIVVSAQAEQWLYAGLSGLLKTAHLENPSFVGQIITVEAGEDAQTLARRLEENGRAPQDYRIRYQHGRRYNGIWREARALSEPVNLPWKERGVYLITGGLGALGLLFAQEIARYLQQGTLVLAGRSAWSTEKAARCKQIETHSLRVVYRQVDISDEQAVIDLVQGVSQEFGHINGIIHSAGVIRDSFIIKKSQEQLLEVLAPKVRGLVNLDLASRELDLDFLVCFSSLAGVLGNTGQADYALANAFMDAYTHYRNELVARQQRRGQTLSINWPLWRDGGLRVDGETEAMIRQRMGMVGMQQSNGIKAFYQCLASGQEQVVVIEGDRARLRAFLGLPPE
ncbi:MAG TPA: type I polyketide synthase, partial [Ktedonobacteraceae bacterium]|nr:type I polyketide synthase [Ktedonobacteraceae bacterium]